MTNLDEPTHGEYDGAVQIIKAAILRSQYAAARSVNEEQLKLYFGIGKYISLNSRKGFWGKGANIGGGGSNLAVATAKLPDESFWQLKLPKSAEFPLEEFLRIGFDLLVQDLRH